MLRCPCRNILMFLREQERWNDLYWATGDGGPKEDTFNNAQDLDNLLGAIVRISVPSFEGASDLYRIPSGNYQGKISNKRRFCRWCNVFLLLLLLLVPLSAGCCLDTVNNAKTPD